MDPAHRASPPRLTLPLLLLPLLLLAPACSSTRVSAAERQRRIEVYRDTAAGYLNMGEYERAADQALRGLELEPQDFHLRLYLGRALQKRGLTLDILRAEQIFRALPADQDFRVPLGLAEVLERKGVALDEAARGVRSGERTTAAADPEARSDQLAEQARASWREAAATYEAALALRPDDTEVMNGLVRTRTLLGEMEESLVWSEAILKSTSNERGFWEAQMRRAGISDREEDTIRANLAALTELEVALHLQASATAVRLGRPDDAIAHLTRLIAIHSEIAAAYSSRAQLLVDRQRYEEALADIDAFLRLAELPFEHEDIRRAFRLREACKAALK